MYLFKMQKELIYLLGYVCILWCCLSFFFYYFIEEFLYYLSQFLNEYLIIKDFQDIITIYIQGSFLLSTILTLFYVFFIYSLWKKNLSYNTEIKTYQILLSWYLVIIVFWIVKQDLFFSNWEVFLLAIDKILFDIQPDFYIFFQTIFDDLKDFFLLTIFFYFFYYFFFNKPNALGIPTVKHFRLLFILSMLVYFVYFFSCESFYNFFYFVIISVSTTELIIFTKLFIIELKKIIIFKSKYF